MKYRLMNRFFSRLWRRNKNYSEHELRWLARRHGWALRQAKNRISLTSPGCPVVQFQGKGEPEAPPAPFGKRAPAKP